uniref:Uncharacterized protein LOC105113655 n=1 Tax=Rhizophora mucronata TaxID=61149 RepID=A0A2P2K007_RHIMU
MIPFWISFMHVMFIVSRLNQQKQNQASPCMQKLLTLG